MHGRVALFASMILLCAGCQMVHEVRVDAIGHPTKSAGSGYALELRIPSARPAEALKDKVADAVRKALAARGLFETQAPAEPEVVITLEYGVGPPHLQIVYKPRDMLGIDLWGKIPPNGGATPIQAYDKFLLLTARTPTASGQGRGEELWSVQVQVEDEKPDLEAYLPVLTAALIDHINRHEPAEKTLKIKDGEAREALKRLKAQYSPALGESR